MPYGVAVTPDARTVLVSNQQSGKLALVDAETLTLAPAQPRLGTFPEGITVVSPTRAAAVDWAEDEVVVIDIEARAILGRVKVGNSPRNLVAVPGGGR